MGISGLLVETVMVGGEKFYIFKLEFENQKRNFEIQNWVCFVMRKFQNFVLKLWGHVA